MSKFPVITDKCGPYAMPEEKDEGHKENAGEHVASSDVEAESSADGSNVLPAGEQADANGEDGGDSGGHDAQKRTEVPVESTLASRTEHPIVTKAKQILMPATSIITPGSSIYHHLTEHDGIQRLLEMCMKYADVGIKYPVGPQFIRDNACIVDRKVMLYIVPLATVTEVEVWFVAKEQCLVRGVFTLELLDNETLAELEGEFVKFIAQYVQNRRLH